MIVNNTKHNQDFQIIKKKLVNTGAGFQEKN